MLWMCRENDAEITYQLTDGLVQGKNIGGGWVAYKSRDTVPLRIP